MTMNCAQVHHLSVPSNSATTKPIHVLYISTLTQAVSTSTLHEFSALFSRYIIHKFVARDDRTISKLT